MEIKSGIKVKNLLFYGTLLIFLGLSTQAAALERSYLIDLTSKRMMELGTLGGDSTRAYDVNDAGQVVGYSDTAEGMRHAFITGDNGTGIRDLGASLVGRDSVALDINDTGRVVVSDSYTRSFITGPNGTGMKELRTPSGAPTRAQAINNAGQVTGTFSTPAGGHLFISGLNGEGMRDLGLSFRPSDINSTGQITGDSGDFVPRAFITGPNGEGKTILGTLDGNVFTPANYSRAFSINDAGQLAGESTSNLSPAETHAFITSPNGVDMRDLGTLGGTESFAYGINNAGQVVGLSATSGGAGHAFITGPNGTGMTDLNLLVNVPDGIVLNEAVAINNVGQVIAIAQVIPEPEIYTMLLAGLGLLGFMARCKKMDASALSLGQRSRSESYENGCCYWRHPS